MVILPTEKRIDWTRPPVVVLALVVINLVIYLASAANDRAVFDQAMSYYAGSDLPAKEWSPYVDFRVRSGEVHEADFDDAHDRYLVEMAFDPQFNSYLQETIPYYANGNAAEDRWFSERAELAATVNRTSSRAFGVATDQFSIVNLVTYQFLHGGWMHLIGNMVFLLICGFAVEASLGSQRFLGFYLLGGIGGGLLYQLTHLSAQGSAYLVGASGSISAVMAMYVTLFRLKKIEFFYWLFVFVGYFRAPAIWLLPMYLLIEFAQWLFAADSNIAYTAHIGGFLTGFALVFAAQRWQGHTIDSEYIEQNQDVDQERKALDKVYRAIADYQFNNALQLLDPIFDYSTEREKLLKIKLNLVNALGGDRKYVFLTNCIEDNEHFDRLNQAIGDWWASLTELQQHAIDESNRAQIGLRLIDIDQYKQSEAILYQLLEQNFQQPILAKLARRLAHFYERQGVVAQKARLNELADSLMQSGNIANGAFINGNRT